MRRSDQENEAKALFNAPSLRHMRHLFSSRMPAALRGSGKEPRSQVRMGGVSAQVLSKQVVNGRGGKLGGVRSVSFAISYMTRGRSLYLSGSEFFPCKMKQLENMNCKVFFHSDIPYFYQ